MSTIAPPQPMIAPVPMPVMVPLTSLPLRRITVDEYERIGEAGTLNDPERVELIDGYMVTKMPKGSEHRFSTTEIYQTFTRRLPAGWFAQQEQAVRIPAYDEPEPDGAAVRGKNTDYRQRIPTAADIGLVVEVAQTSLELDRGQKLAAYATAGIPIYWIVNLVERQVEVYTGPGSGAYQARVDYKPGQAVPLMIDGQHLGDIAVDDILP